MLRVRNLNVDLVSANGASVPVLSEISFGIGPAAIVGLFGESGCGKTTLALALLNLLSPSRYRVSGEILWRGRNLVGLADKQLEAVRGAEISMIFQDPLLSLNPVMRVGTQVNEVMRAHGSRKDAGQEAYATVGLPDWRRIAASYPHQLSGGERQRVTIAQALASKPALIVADEPFTALDAVRVVELASLFRSLRDQFQTSFLLISHSPGVLSVTADQVLVMHGGRIVRSGVPRAVLHA